MNSKQSSSSLSVQKQSLTTGRSLWFLMDGISAVCQLEWHVLSDEKVEILDLFVMKERAGWGFGKYLLSYFLSDQLKGQDVWLEVSSKNRPALKLYGSCGFVQVGYRKQYYLDGSDAVLMEWSSKA